MIEDGCAPFGTRWSRDRIAAGLVVAALRQYKATFVDLHSLPSLTGQ